ncbi:alpha-1,2-fucosyltransferase [Salegentibacter sediminis]|uniref:alpha-1,2-fucosyltransferase n=1 Tax=Salegentibacter sediminis TaxID=1930251 RepID=UPI0009C020AA|nr:alpha-1,2-fucosyltransferase [Salegentibacter sediminis]
MRNIILIKLNGGLGNQMFQYALGRLIALKHEAEILLDKELFDLTEIKPGHTPREYELEIFGLDHASASKEDINYFEQLTVIHKIRRELNLNYPKMCFEKDFRFDAKIERAVPPLYLRGFFQTYKYYSGYEEIVREFFKFPNNKLDPENRKTLAEIKGTKSVAVHIRRGDYVKDNITNKVHGVCGLEYYQKAIEKMKEMDNEMVFYFFSDDMDWVKTKFGSLEGEKKFITKNDGDNSWKDMMLMSSCDHNIIANSSFSWWAAWLNTNKSKMVIAPKRWFKDPDKEQFTSDLIPKEWIRL